MSEMDLLQSAMRALSLFNTIASLWLGLTVLLNAERRPAGTWLIGGGLLMAGLFFALHSTLVGREVDALFADIPLLWPYLWLLFVCPPYIWYVVVDWYCGLLGSTQHRMALCAVGMIGAAALTIPALPGLLPSFDQILGPLPAEIPAAAGVPVAILVYPLYSVVCFGLALAALQRPGMSKRFMGEIGRQRARPWLIGASALLLIVGMGLGLIAYRFFDGVRTGWLDLYSSQSVLFLFRVDVVVSGLIALVVVLLGRAIVSYEIFTGKVLPRGGLRRYWRNGLILAAGYGALMAASLQMGLDPAYRLVLATLLIALFYGLLSWRSYAEYERGMERLRPFVTSHHLYERLIRPATPLEMDVQLPFKVLCEELLDTRVAHLISLDPLSTLGGTTLSYPPGSSPPGFDPGTLVSRLSPKGAVAARLDAGQFGGATWAIPLWSERGLVGALLIGEKRGGGLYVQEEIEVARATGERLIDIQASAELARRLMAVQRQRLAESQVVDRRVRRVLHDEVLPSLHTAILSLSGLYARDEAVAAVAETLAQSHRRIADLLHETPASAPEVARLGLVGALRQVVDVELSGAFDGVTWQVDREAEKRTRSISPLVAEVVYGAAREAVRNAARHGRGTDADRPLHLILSVDDPDGLRVVIEDDGVGVGKAKGIGGGSGQGLALHSAMMAVVGGTLAIDTQSGSRTRVSLMLPHVDPGAG
jgi:signal transduction histidine kinase